MKIINSVHGKIEVLDLATVPDMLPVCAAWVEQEWGYVRNKGVDFRIELFKQYIKTDNIPNMYALVLSGKPIGMFSIEECEGYPKSLFFNYLFILSEYRGVGIGKEAVNLAIAISKDYRAESLQLTTLSTSLNDYYEAFGGRVVGDVEGERFYTYPATRMEISL